MLSKYPLVSGDLAHVVANSVVIDPSDANTWYLATDTGVYRTQNSGTNWLPFDNGIPNVPVAGLVVDPASKILYAGTMGRGAFKLDITPAVTKPVVDLYVRDDNVDTGERLPSPSGIQDPLIPAPGQLLLSGSGSPRLRDGDETRQEGIIAAGVIGTGFGRRKHGTPVARNGSSA
jgi:hypothetical protein